MLTRRRLLASSAGTFAPRRARRPNLLLIVADEWRGQAVPWAGDPNIQTPNLLALARTSVNVARAYTVFPVCCPSRAALLTGKYPRSNGVTRNHTLLPLDNRTLSAELQDAGYRTGFIGKWHLDGGANPGFVPAARRRGFDYWAAQNVDHRHYEQAYFRDSEQPIRIPGFAAAHQAELATEFLAASDGRPFFLYLSILPPHPPLSPPADAAKYDPQKLRLRPNVPAEAAAEARKLLAGYYGLCSAADAQVGRVLTALDRAGASENTIVAFTSDHGNTLGSHGVGEINLPWEESARVPLLIRYPAALRPRVERDAIVSNVDLAPTLAALCGLSAVPGMEGRNLAPWLSGKAPPPESIYAEGQTGQEGEWRMVVNGRYKLVGNAALEPVQLFDLRRDPYELHNLAGGTRHGGLRERLAAELRQNAQGFKVRM